MNMTVILCSSTSTLCRRAVTSCRKTRPCSCVCKSCESSQCATPQGLSVVWQPMLGYLTCTLNRVPSAHIHSLYLSKRSLRYGSPPKKVLGMRDGLNITEPFRTMLFSCVRHSKRGLLHQVVRTYHALVHGEYSDASIG